MKDEIKQKYDELRNKNYLYKHLKGTIKMIHLKNEYYDSHHKYYGANTFKELNVFCLSAPRQMGRTSAIKKAFNPKKDFYMSYNTMGAKELINPVIGLDNGEVYFEFSQEEIDLINKRKCFRTINVQSRYIDIYNQIPNGKVTIYLDLCSVELDKERENINKFIDGLITYYTNINKLEELYKKVVVFT